MTYTLSSPTIGCPDVTTVVTNGGVGTPNALELPSVTTEAKLGQVVEAWDATLGSAQFILLQVPKSTTITVGLLYQFDTNYTVTLVPAISTSKNTGVALACAYTAVTSNANAIQFAWFLIRGSLPILKTAVAAAPAVPIYISATAGRIKILSSAGGQILGGRTNNTVTASAGQSTVVAYLNFSALEGA
jgi:hypothetical protein